MKVSGTISLFMFAALTISFGLAQRAPASVPTCLQLVSSGAPSDGIVGHDQSGGQGSGGGGGGRDGGDGRDGGMTDRPGSQGVVGARIQHHPLLSGPHAPESEPPPGAKTGRLRLVDSPSKLFTGPLGPPPKYQVRLTRTHFEIQEGVHKIVPAFSVLNHQITEFEYAFIMYLARIRKVGALAPSRSYRRLNTETGAIRYQLPEPVQIGNLNLRVSTVDPVESISFREADAFVEVLNTLSNSNQDIHHQALSFIFPGHTPGKKYSLPTNAQLDLIFGKLKTKGGDSVSEIITSLRTRDLADSILYSGNSSGLKESVFAKEPLFLNGNPVYFFGNVMTWTADYHGSFLTHNPADPPATSNFRIIRGAAWSMSKFMVKDLFSGENRQEHYGNERMRSSDVGLMIVSD